MAIGFSMAWISGVGLTAYGSLPGRDALGWQEMAARLALTDAAVRPAQVQGLVVGYATTLNHLMPANLLAQTLGLVPELAFGLSVGGATGLAMVARAARLVQSGELDRVLVVAGENRASGQSRATSTAALAQVGHPDYEVPLGATVPAFYGLIASRYLRLHRLQPEALAPLAVQLRAHAAETDGAQFRTLMTVEDVRHSRVVAAPLRLLDCCPVSDGGAAVLITAQPLDERSVEIVGLGQANLHQHLCEADLDDVGARRSARRALEEAGIGLGDIDVAGIYDSFTVTLAVLLEEIGFSAPGQAGEDAARGVFARTGRLPLNTHGGLLSYGHCGVAGGLAHLVEVTRRLRAATPLGAAGRAPKHGLVHADGGVLSAHVTAIVRRGELSASAA